MLPRDEQEAQNAHSLASLASKHTSKGNHGAIASVIHLRRYASSDLFLNTQQ